MSDPASERAGIDLRAHGLLAPDGRPSLPGDRPHRVGEVLDRVLAASPERLALVGRHGRLSYGALDRAANRAAAALSSLGVRLGDRVAACLPNDVDIVVALLGVARLGAIWVGVNRPLAGPEKAHQLRDAGARVYLASPDMARQIEPRRGDLPSLEQVIAVDPEDATARWSTLLAAAPDGPRPEAGSGVDPFTPAAIAYTSGTTGLPKGAVHSHHNLLLPGALAAERGLYGPDVSQGTVLPLTILNLVVLSPLFAFQDGSACVAIDRIDAVGIAEWVRDEQVGHFAAVPTVFHDLLTHPDVEPADLASLRHPEVGGADCPEELRALYRERFGAEVTIGYGMTEAPTVVTRSRGEPSAKPGLCGTALPHLRVEIRGEDDRRLPAGELGEICVGAATEGDWAGLYTPMLGYWNQPEATERALRDGVYHTGDLGLLDADGTLYIRGRRNELILRGGANVYPAEVERVLVLHPAVAAAAVLGIPDERLGERVVAAVELEPGQEVEPGVLEAHCREQLARYKTPERICIVEAMPRNAMNKIVKRELALLFD